MLRRHAAKSIESHICPSMMWRASGCLPLTEAFQLGFTARNESATNLMLHVSGEHSSYVSFGPTLADVKQHLRPGRFVYHTATPEIYVDVPSSIGFAIEDDATLSEKGLCENEIACATSMRPSDIYQARQWSTIENATRAQPSFSGPTYTNTNFRVSRNWSFEILSLCPIEAALYQTELYQRKMMGEDMRYLTSDEAKEISAAFHDEFRHYQYFFKVPMHVISRVPSHLEGSRLINAALSHHHEKMKSNGISLSRGSFPLFSPKIETSRQENRDENEFRNGITI